MRFLKRPSDKKPSVKDLIHARVGGHEPARQYDVIHASMLTKTDGFCPREVAIMLEEGVKVEDQFIDTALRLTFDQGWIVQSKINNDYLRDVMFGTWECSYCDYYSVGLGGGEVCVHCDQSLEYKEVHLHDEECDFHGSIDGFVLMGGELHVLEVKIMDKDMWIDLVMPLGEHQARTQLYLDMVARNVEELSYDHPDHLINTDYAHIIYVMRGHGKKDPEGRISPFKEFTIQADAEASQAYRDMAKAVSQYKKDGVVPTEKICDTSTCTRAKACPVSDKCFGYAYKDRG